MRNDSRRTDDDLVYRLRCVEGHLRGIAVMVERGERCEDVVAQTLAVQGGLREVSRRLANRHLAVCLSERSMTNQTARRAQVISEVVALYRAIGPDR